MEFKVGDTVRRKVEYQHNSWDCYIDDVGRTLTIERTDYEYLYFAETGSQSWGSERFDLVSSANSILKKTMRKRIYRVLIVDKKTGKTTKDEAVVAETEQQAILKAFGVDSANSFISVKEEGNFEEEKPITAVIVKDSKEPKA